MGLEEFKSDDYCTLTTRENALRGQNKVLRRFLEIGEALATDVSISRPGDGYDGTDERPNGGFTVRSLAVEGRQRRTGKNKEDQKLPLWSSRSFNLNGGLARAAWPRFGLPRALRALKPVPERCGYFRPRRLPEEGIGSATSHIRRIQAMIHGTCDWQDRTVVDLHMHVLSPG